MLLRYSLATLLFLTLLIAVLSLAVSTPVRAQTSSPDVVLSWRVVSYVPLWYEGKAFPTRSTPIEVRLSLLETGRMVNVSQNKIRWYVNDKLVSNESNGLGTRTLRVNASPYIGQDMEIRAVIVDYAGGAQSAVITIPVSAPEVVILQPFAGNLISRSGTEFYAYPFFFNVASRDNLSIIWTLNGQEADAVSGNPWQLALTVDSRTPSGFLIQLRAMVRNLQNQIEFAAKALSFQVQ